MVCFSLRKGRAALVALHYFLWQALFIAYFHMAGKGASSTAAKKTSKQNLTSGGVKTGDIASFFGGKPLPADKKTANSPASRSAVISKKPAISSKLQRNEKLGSGSHEARMTSRMRTRDSLPKKHRASEEEEPTKKASEVESPLGSEKSPSPTAKIDGNAPSSVDATLKSTDGAASRGCRKRRIIVDDDDDDDDDSDGDCGYTDHGKSSDCDEEGGVSKLDTAACSDDAADDTAVDTQKLVEKRRAKSVAGDSASPVLTGKKRKIAETTPETAKPLKQVRGENGSLKSKRNASPDVEKCDDIGGDENPSEREESPVSKVSDSDCESGDEDDEEDCGTGSRSNARGVAADGKSGSKSGEALSYDFGEKPSWKKGTPVPYRFLADAFNKVEQIHGRLEIQAILTDVFRKIIDTTPEDILPTIYLCMNKLSAAHEGIESGVGEFILLKALSHTSGSTVAALKAKYREVGDLGDVAAGARATQTTMFPPPPLKIRSVFSEMKSIALSAGKTSTAAKKSKILKLLVASQSKNETRYLARAMQGKLRIHLAVKTVVTSLANAFTLRRSGTDAGFLLDVEGNKKTKLSDKERKIEDELKMAANGLSAIYNQLPVWEKIVPALLKHQEISSALAEDCKFTPGIPVSPMLAKPTKAITEVLTRFENVKFTCEYKYDGERAQVHRLADGTVKVYSRNAEDLTEKYPDIVNSIPSALKEEHKGVSFVLDAETVAYDVEKKRILPFQDLQGRKRKDVAAGDVTVTVCLFAFDLLFFSGKSLLLEPLAKRRDMMHESFEEVQGVFFFAEGHDSRDTEEIMELLNRSIKSGCEGLMVKALDGENATYEPANRSQNWLKVKKDYLDGVGDTLDLVPIGGYLGKGKRLGTYGGFLLACYDQENEVYQSICKIGTGFSDADLESFSKFYNAEEEDRRLDNPKSYFQVSDNKNLQPDVWFEPCQVWEVLCADLSVSPLHKAALGLVDDSKGIALRFPRFVRIRDDKGPEDATDASQVAELYAAQSSVANKC